MSEKNPYVFHIGLDPVGSLVLFVCRSNHERESLLEREDQEKEVLFQFLNDIQIQEVIPLFDESFINQFEQTSYALSPTEKPIFWGSWFQPSRQTHQVPSGEEIFLLLKKFCKREECFSSASKIFLRSFLHFEDRLLDLLENRAFFPFCQEEFNYVFQSLIAARLQSKISSQNYRHFSSQAAGVQIPLFDLTDRDLKKLLGTLSFLPSLIELNEKSHATIESNYPHVYQLLFQLERSKLNESHYLFLFSFFSLDFFPQWKKGTSFAREPFSTKTESSHPLLFFLRELCFCPFPSHILSLSFYPEEDQQTLLKLDSFFWEQKRTIHEKHLKKLSPWTLEAFLDRSAMDSTNPILSHLGHLGWVPLNLDRVLQILSFVFDYPQFFANLKIQKVGQMSFSDAKIKEIKLALEKTGLTQKSHQKKKKQSDSFFQKLIPVELNQDPLVPFYSFLSSTLPLKLHLSDQKGSQPFLLYYDFPSLSSFVKVQIKWEMEKDPHSLTQLLKDHQKKLADQKDYSLDTFDALLKSFFQRLSYSPQIRFVIDQQQYSIQDFQNVFQRGDGTWELAKGQCLSQAQYEEAQKQIQSFFDLSAGHSNISIKDLWRTHQKIILKRKSFSQMETYAKKLEFQLSQSQLFSDAQAIEWIHSQMLPLIQKSVQADLRAYQIEGIAWLYAKTTMGLGVCLADDMGLGKTLQILSYLSIVASVEKPFLVVVPKSLVLNWIRETQRYVPHLDYAICLEDEPIPQVPLVITSYPRVRLSSYKISQHPWYGVILDEAHTIKNNETQISKSIRSLKPKVKIAITGTPIENRATELWSLCDWLNSNWLGSSREFNQYTNLARNSQEKKALLDPIKMLLKPIILRRTKSEPEIAKSLPKKIFQLHSCQSSNLQKKLYSLVLEDVLKQWEQVDGTSVKRALFLKAILHFKQICNHPLVFLDSLEKDTEKHEWFVKQSPPDLQAFLQRKKVSADWVDQSGKLNLVMDLFDNFKLSSRGILIFTQFHSSAQLLLQVFRERYPEYEQAADFLHGSIDVNARMKMVDKFLDLCQKKNDLPPILILSLKVGGAGLNLAGADTIIHFDRWWNPAVEDQATDRAHRIGQKSTVFVHSLATVQTIEESLISLIDDKRELVRDLLSEKEGPQLRDTLKSRSSFLDLVDPTRYFSREFLEQND